MDRFVKVPHIQVTPPPEISKCTLHRSSKTAPTTADPIPHTHAHTLSLKNKPNRSQFQVFHTQEPSVLSLQNEHIQVFI
ncbi:hypothetical protein L1987_29785 [Smallanthus sonchifolius]|uniref:Uncharacterized protein n=1 Tax=Smallanthus sonchifolius TaxID=185202 RepID=A0ACB9I1S5_9ASTR|nr:hypothetical protein L1987_29785 [Smallanthus sonchifolius]